MEAACYRVTNKFVPVYAIKVHKRSRGVFSLILYLITRWGELWTTRSGGFNHRKEPPYHHFILIFLESSFQTFLKVAKSFGAAGIRTSGSSIPQPSHYADYVTQAPFYWDLSCRMYQEIRFYVQSSWEIRLFSRSFVLSTFRIRPVLKAFVVNTQ
jgi:hypothetical protein